MTHASPTKSVLASLWTGLHAPAQISIAQLIAGRQNAAYTSIMIDQGMRLVDWQLHVERLVRGVELLHQEDPQLYTKLLTWPRVAQGGTAALTACLAPHLRQLASQALHSFSQMAQVQPHDSASPDGAHAPQQVVPHACAGMMFMLVGERVVPSAQSTEAGTSAAPGPSQPPTASTSLQQPSTAPPLPVDIEVLCIPYSAPSPDIGIDVAVMGPPRHIAHAKHSEWMLTRKSLEAATPPGMSEVLLSGEDGGLLEGLVTNVAVIATRASDGQPVLYTTGPQDQALPGLMLRRVLDACRVIGLEVVMRAPRAAERATWQEAFLTSSMRGLQPIRRISCVEGNHWGHEPWELELPGGAPGPVTRKLQSAVAALQLRSSAADLMAAQETQ